MIGVDEEQQAEHVVAVASTVRRVAKASVNISQYAALLSERIVPTVEGVEFRWHSERSEAADGILVIQVPPQQDKLRPFLVTKIVDVDGKDFPAFACPTRNQARTEWMRPDRVQYSLHLASTIIDKLAEQSAATRIAASSVGIAAAAAVAETLAGRIASEPAQQQQPITPSELDARGNLLRLAAGAGEDACIVIQAHPPAPLDLLTRMFGADGLVSALRDWKGIRNLGFDLTTGHEPESENGNLIVKGQVAPDGTPGWLLRIDSDGVLQLALPFRYDFLGWALHREEDGKVNPRINGLVLVEIVLDYFRFLRTHLDATGTWSARLSASSMKHFNVELHSGYRRREDWAYGGRPHVASGNEYTQSFPCPGPAERDAFECLLRIYGLWSFGAEAIPFTKNNAVVPAEIIALRS